MLKTSFIRIEGFEKAYQKGFGLFLSAVNTTFGLKMVLGCLYGE